MDKNYQHQKTDNLLLLSELVQKLEDRFDMILKEKYETSFSEWKLLLAVFLAQQNPTQEQIAAQAAKTPAAVSRQLGLLEDRELVERSTSKDSKRTKLVKLTAKGKNLLHKSLMLVSSQSRIIFSKLGADQARFKDNTIDLLEYLEDVR